MRPTARLTAWLTLVCAAGAQCLIDPQDNSICATAQNDTNVCGYPIKILGSLHGPTFYCHDILVTKTAPDGHTIYRTAFGGSSEDTPGQLFLDAQGNAVVLGATWSHDFPVTTGAAYAGPAPSIGTGYTLPAGGDLFAAEIDASGKLVYATYLGSSGIDSILGLRDAGDGLAEVLVAAGAGDFPVTSAAAGARSGPVLVTFDLNRRMVVRSAYLPIGDAAEYIASMRENGVVAVTTRTGLYTFEADGAPRTFVPIDSFGFRTPPTVSMDSASHVWLSGTAADRVPLVAMLTERLTEVFRWKLPEDPAGAIAGYAYLSTPVFGPDGLAYFRGNADLLFTTPNALLAIPCTQYYSSILAVLSAQGEVRMLTYLPGVSSNVPSVDFSLRPKAGCALDALRPYSVFAPFGAGQVVRLRGGGFGPDAPVTVEVDGIAAPVLATSPGEVIFTIPWAVRENDTVPITVSSRGDTSAALPVALRQLAPAVVEPIFNVDGTPNRFDSSAAWGSTITIFLTGAGPYTPLIKDGQPAPLDATHALAARVSAGFQIAGPDAEPAAVLYAGPAPGYVGLAQINVRLPAARPFSFSSIGPVITIGGLPLFVPSVWVK